MKIGILIQGSITEWTPHIINEYKENFPEAEILLFTRTSPTSAVVASVYPDEETAKKAKIARNARMDKAVHRRKSAEMHQGEVTLKIVR